LDDEDFEFMLKVMRMIQEEQDIRYRTRALEQLRRALGFEAEGYSLPLEPALN
jgi:transposase